MEKILKKKKDHKSEFDGFIVNMENQKVLVKEKDKDKLFPWLTGIEIIEKIHVNYVGGFTLALLLAQKIFGDAKEVIKDGVEFLVIKDKISMCLVDPGKTALVEFVSSPKTDIMADQFCFLLSNIHYDPLLEENLIKENQVSHSPAFDIVYKTVLEDYPESTMSNGVIIVNWRGNNVGVMNLRTKTVDSKDEYMMMRLQGIMEGLIADPEKMEEE